MIATAVVYCDGSGLATGGPAGIGYVALAGGATFEGSLEAVARHGSVRFLWLRGHAGNEWNERADSLAGEARLRAQEAALAPG